MKSQILIQNQSTLNFNEQFDSIKTKKKKRVHEFQNWSAQINHNLARGMLGDKFQIK